VIKDNILRLAKLQVDRRGRSPRNHRQGFRIRGAYSSAGEEKRISRYLREENVLERSLNAKTCACCGQPLTEIRLGVRLMPLKARIFDAVRRGGGDGIDRRNLFNIVFGDDDAHSRKHGFHTLKVHIVQINELIEDTGYRIEGRSAARLFRRCAQT
jgi:hypothetical protein